MVKKKEQPDYSKMGLLKKLFVFIKYILNFLRNKKIKEHAEIIDDLKEDYAKVDKKKESKKNEDIQKRLDNLF